MKACLAEFERWRVEEEEFEEGRDQTLESLRVCKMLRFYSTEGAKNM